MLKATLNNQLFTSYDKAKSHMVALDNKNLEHTCVSHAGDNFVVYWAQIENVEESIIQLSLLE